MTSKIIFNLEYCLNNIKEAIKVINNEGLIIIRNAIMVDECDSIKADLDAVLDARVSNGHYYGNESNQVLDNYFMDNKSLLKLIYHEITDKLMRKLIDDDYVLISPSARNRRNWKKNKLVNITSGHGWHTDSRFVGGKGIKPSLSYMSIACIDAFTKNNGCTHYIPRSHLLYQRPQNREQNMEHEYLIANKGDIVILDTALWHRVGDASKISRWGIFNTYGPWFMKPYHRFLDMFEDKEIKDFDPIIKQLLHYDSNPPRDHNESMITLRRVRTLLNKNEN